MGKSGALGIEKITRAAVKIADKEGLQKLSMRKLAKSLGIEAMSLYNHINNKEELFDRMTDYFYSQIEFNHKNGDWIEAMKERARSVRENLKKHRWALKLLDSRENPGFPTLNHHDQVLGCLIEANFSLKQAGHAYSALDAYIFGFAIQDQNLPFENEDELEVLAEQITNSIPDGELVYFKRFTIEYILQPGYSFDQEFETGLQSVLEGVRSLLN